jgi:hypothetical protein
VTLTVSAGPLPHDNAYSLPDSGPLTVPADQGVLANAFNPAGAALTAELAQPPASGTLHLYPDGGFDYTADPAQPPGDVTFTFQVNPRGAAAAAATVHLLIQGWRPTLTLTRQEFTGAVTLTKDDGSDDYVKAWTPTSGRVPVAAVAGGRLGWEAQFRVTAPQLLAVKKERLAIVGINVVMNPSVTPEFKLDVARSTLTVVWSDNPVLPTRPWVNDQADQTWWVRPGWYARGSDYLVSAGTSQFKYYVLAGRPPRNFTLFHTVARVGTLAAQSPGGSSADDIKRAAIALFQTRSVERADGPVAGAASAVLTYYGKWTAAEDGLRTTPLLLKNGDGNCQAWAPFFLDVLIGQGITDPGQAYSVKAAKADSWMFVKSWQGPDWPTRAVNQFTGREPADLAAKVYTWVPRVPVTKRAGSIPGQGTNEPLAIFRQHQFVKLVIGGVTSFFDPSYGTGPFAGTDDLARLRNWQNNSLDYVGRQVGQTISFDLRVRPDDGRDLLVQILNPR